MASAAFGCRGASNPAAGLQSLQVMPSEVECEAHAVQQLRALGGVSQITSTLCLLHECLLPRDAFFPFANMAMRGLDFPGQLLDRASIDLAEFKIDCGGSSTLARGQPTIRRIGRRLAALGRQPEIVPRHEARPQRFRTSSQRWTSISVL